VFNNKNGEIMLDKIAQLMGKFHFVINSYIGRDRRRGYTIIVRYPCIPKRLPSDEWGYEASIYYNILKDDYSRFNKVQEAYLRKLIANMAELEFEYGGFDEYEYVIEGMAFYYKGS
jgi:hypothetical protein